MKRLVDFINERGPAPKFNKNVNEYDQCFLKHISDILKCDKVSIDDIMNDVWDTDEAAEILDQYPEAIKNIQNRLDKYKNMKFYQIVAEEKLWWDIVDEMDGEPAEYEYLTPDEINNESAIMVGFYESDELVEFDVMWDGIGDKYVAFKKIK